MSSVGVAPEESLATMAIRRRVAHDDSIVDESGVVVSSNCTPQ